MELLPVKELFPLTGYVRGGCTAIGMKKQFPTVLHVSAMEQDTIFVSGGRLGLQIQLKPEDFLAACGGVWKDVTV